MKTLSRSIAFALFVLGVFGQDLAAAPSGGPYGPIQLNYELPKTSGKLYFAAPDGDAKGDGSSIQNATTIEAAIERARSGDAIVLRGGVYRVGELLLNQGITIQPYRNERPILKGTRVAEDWEPLRFGLWATSWDRLFPMQPQGWWRREREGKRTPMYLFNNDMVFVDGRLLKPVGWEGEVDEDSYYINYELGRVYIGFDPKGHTIEITAYDNAFTRVAGELRGVPSDKKGFTLRGVVMTQYAYRAIEIEGYDPEGVSPESEHGKDVVGTTIEHCEFSYCSRVGAYLRGDKLVFRHNLVSDTSTEGIFLLASNDALFERNIFRRNNIEGITGYFPSAVKIFNQTNRVVCRENLVTENKNSNGIWYDVGNQDGVFVNNWIQDCQSGFFFEISKRAICAGNVFVNCEEGVRSLNSSGVRVYANTFVNSRVDFERTARSSVGDHFGWHPATGPEVEERVDHVFEGNLLFADAEFEGPMIRFAQPAELRERLKMDHIKSFKGNVFARRGSAESSQPLIMWSPAETETGITTYDSLDAFRHAEPQFENEGAYLSNYYGPLFKSLELQRYQLHPDFPASQRRVHLPEEVRELLDAEGVDAVGAFPVAE